MCLDGVEKKSRAKRPLIVAVEVVAIADSQDVTVSLVEPNTIRNPSVLPSPALKPSVYDVGDRPVPGQPTSRTIPGRRAPPPRDDVVAGGLGRLRRHPEPQGCLEGYHCVIGHQVRVVEQVHSYGPPALSVVVVPVISICVLTVNE